MRQLKIVTQITNRESRSVEKYLQDISRISMITAEEETILARKIRAGDKNAQERLVNANLRFVVSVAKQYQHQGLSLSDLINEGNVGLIKAAGRFDETKGFKFISYAVWWIRQSILQALAEQGRLIRLPQNKIGAYSKARRAFDDFEQQYEREPSMEELAEILETSPEEIRTLFKTNKRHSSIDAPVLTTDDELPLSDLIVGESDASENVLNDSLREEINRILDTLTQRESEVVKAYFGLDGYYGISIEEVGEKYNLTKERIRQIKERTIKRLRHKRYTDVLQSYLG